MMEQSHKGPVIIIIIAVVIIGAVAIGLYLSPHNKPATSGSTSTATITPITNFITGGDPTADWKLQVSKSSGFSIKTPSDWVYKNSPAPAGLKGKDGSVAVSFINPVATDTASALLEALGKDKGLRTMNVTFDGQSAVYSYNSDSHTGIEVVVVKYPRAVSIGGVTVNYIKLIGEGKYLLQIASTLKFLR